MKLLEVEGARDPVPHSWRRHCILPQMESQQGLRWHVGQKGQKSRRMETVGRMHTRQTTSVILRL